jgi:hypothetical protein
MDGQGRREAADIIEARERTRCRQHRNTCFSKCFAIEVARKNAAFRKDRDDALSVCLVERHGGPLDGATRTLPQAHPHDRETTAPGRDGSHVAFDFPKRRPHHRTVAGGFDCRNDITRDIFDTKYQQPQAVRSDERAPDVDGDAETRAEVVDFTLGGRVVASVERDHETIKPGLGGPTAQDVRFGEMGGDEQVDERSGYHGRRLSPMALGGKHPPILLAIRRPGLSRPRGHAKLRRMSRVVAIIAATVAIAAAAPSSRADMDGGWLGLRVGISTTDTLLLGDGGDSFTSDAPPSASLGIWGCLRLGLIDIGLVVETASAAGTPAVGIDERMYGQLRILPTFRWRFLDDLWGGAVMGIGIGASVTRLSDFLRFEIGRTRSLELGAIEQNPVALAMALDFGIYINLDDTLRLTLLFGVHNSSDRLQTGNTSERFFTLQGVFSAGIEWHL